ncbi:MAG: molecular chaperone DnaJ, partial [Planctomycetales bacterium]
MSEKRDFYDVLGVERDATDKQIADAYRKLALKYHPDRNPDDEDASHRFKEATEAYKVLTDPQQRGRYDQYGHAGLDGMGSPADFGDLGDLLSEVFGGGFADFFGGGGGGGGARGRRRVRKGSDVRCDLTLDLMEAARGAEKTVRVQREKKCKTCDGSGAKPGSSPESCKFCGGRGQVLQEAGFVRVQTTCPRCRGQGSVIRDRCPTCRGQQVVAEEFELEIKIPAGVDNDNMVPIRGQGNPSPDADGPPGDCYCVIHVDDHPLFQREGHHLICELPITFSQAALGATVEAPTLDGPEPLEIPAGIQPNEIIRLRGRGMPDPRGRG